jgi:hypothetical protein
VLLLPGLHENLERGVDRFAGLFNRSILGPLAQRRKRGAKVVLSRGPVERHPSRLPSATSVQTLSRAN